jgi:hypothetical protein
MTQHGSRGMAPPQAGGRLAMVPGWLIKSQRRLSLHQFLRVFLNRGRPRDKLFLVSLHTRRRLAALPSATEPELGEPSHTTIGMEHPDARARGPLSPAVAVAPFRISVRAKGWHSGGKKSLPDRALAAPLPWRKLLAIHLPRQVVAGPGNTPGGSMQARGLPAPSWFEVPANPCPSATGTNRAGKSHQAWLRHVS